MKTLLIIIGLILAWFFFIKLPFFGIHIQTAKGSHVGYITATDTSGLFFKTNAVYLKTDTQSSQEDNYCVIDKGVFEELRKQSEAHAHVDVQYIEYLSAGIINCDIKGSGIIISVKVIQ